MGWLWGSKDDPVKNLDPGLREYLEHEAPKYAPAPSQDSQGSRQTDGSSSPSQTASPSVPNASLFPDGRYAHLWKTYTPPQEENPEVKGAERVIGKEKERKDTVQRAAMENCALEHEALTYCFQTGNWQKQLKARVTLCSEENSTFSRCFTTQAKFLQALGYASSFTTDADKEERIQMHADKLYHQMLDYEKQVDLAREAGREPPPLTSLFNPQASPSPAPAPAAPAPAPTQPSSGASAVEIPGGESIPAGFKPSKPLHLLTPHERELEIRAHNSQLEQRKLYMQEASPFIKSQEDARAKRQQKAVSWFGETIGRWIT